MRAIHRDIVGGFILSKDGKILLGKNRAGGVYEGAFVVPGGGIEAGETKLEALRREMLEETGIDVATGTITEINVSSGSHEKTLRDTGERVIVDMNFYDYRINLPQDASDITVIAEDDWSEPQWFSRGELGTANLGPPTKLTLVKVGLMTP
jgi:8-oxo-dGTP pyrophosphatase MutT (NUDIX family)